MPFRLCKRCFTTPEKFIHWQEGCAFDFKDWRPSLTALRLLLFLLLNVLVFHSVFELLPLPNYKLVNYLLCSVYFGCRPFHSFAHGLSDFLFCTFIIHLVAFFTKANGVFPWIFGPHSFSFFFFFHLSFFLWTFKLSLIEITLKNSSNTNGRSAPDARDTKRRLFTETQRIMKNRREKKLPT